MLTGITTLNHEVSKDMRKSCQGVVAKIAILCADRLDTDFISVYRHETLVIQDRPGSSKDCGHPIYTVYVTLGLLLQPLCT